MQDTPQPGAAASVVSVRSKAVQAVHSPLGFFVLALLIVETFLLGAGSWFNLSEPWRVASIGIGVALFLVVFATVVWLVVKHPQNLVFSEESHVQFAAMQIYGSEAHTLTGRDLQSLPSSIPPQPPVGQLPRGSGGVS